MILKGFDSVNLREGTCFLHSTIPFPGQKSWPRFQPAPLALCFNGFGWQSKALILFPGLGYLSLLSISPAMGRGRPGGQEFPSVLSPHECAAHCQLARGHRRGLKALALSSAAGNRARSRNSDFPSCFKPHGIPDTDLVTFQSFLYPCVSRCSTRRAPELVMAGSWFPEGTRATPRGSAAHSLVFPFRKSSALCRALCWHGRETGSDCQWLWDSSFWGDESIS